QAHAPDALPLYGVPFAVKDNIDVEGLPTTAACPAYAYGARAHATCVQRLLDAGAVLLGKTNLDQFATGLVGTRSPYGAVPNTLDTVSVFALTVADAARVLALIEGGDDANVVAPASPAASAFPSALRVGVPQSPGLDGSLGYVAAFAQQIDRVTHLG